MTTDNRRRTTEHKTGSNIATVAAADSHNEAYSFGEDDTTAVLVIIQWIMPMTWSATTTAMRTTTVTVTEMVKPLRQVVCY